MAANHPAIVRAASVRDAIKAVNLVRGKDDMMPVLTCAHIKVEGDSVVLMATDRFQMIEATLPLQNEVHKIPEPTPFETLVPATGMRLLLGAIGRPYMHQDIRVRLTGRKDRRRIFRVEVWDAATTVVEFAEEEGQWPSMGQLWPKGDKAVPAIGFNPKFMGALCRMPGMVGPRSVCELHFSGPRTPMTATWGDPEDIEYRYALMPMRLPVE